MLQEDMAAVWDGTERAIAMVNEMSADYLKSSPQDIQSIIDRDESMV